MFTAAGGRMTFVPGGPAEQVSAGLRTAPPAGRTLVDRVPPGRRPRRRTHTRGFSGRGQRHGDRGSVSIQMVVLLPVLFSVMFLGMQAALYYHARAVAIAAAQEGARAAGVENGTVSSGVAAAASFVAVAGGADVLAGASASGSRGAATATVTVRGTSLSVVPGWTLTVTQSATVPVERITG